MYLHAERCRKFQPRAEDISCNRKRNLVSLRPERRDRVSPRVGGLNTQPYDENSHVIRPQGSLLTDSGTADFSNTRAFPNLNDSWP